MIDERLIDMFPKINPTLTEWRWSWDIRLFEGGYVYYYINGIYYIHTLEFCNDLGLSNEDALIWILKFGEQLPRKLEKYDTSTINRLHTIY